MSKTSPEIWLTKLENTTTTTDLLKLKSGGPFSKVASVSQQGFQITLPKGSCPKGHLVLIDCALLINGIQHSMQATGQVIETTSDDEQNLVNIEFKNFDKKIWSKLMDQLSLRQHHVAEIFESIRGQK